MEAVVLHLFLRDLEYVVDFVAERLALSTLMAWPQGSLIVSSV